MVSLAAALLVKVTSSVTEMSAGDIMQVVRAVGRLSLAHQKGPVGEEEKYNQGLLGGPGH